MATIEDKIKLYPFFTGKKLTKEEWQAHKEWRTLHPDLLFRSGDPLTSDRLFKCWHPSGINGIQTQTPEQRERNRISHNASCRKCKKKPRSESQKIAHSEYKKKRYIEKKEEILSRCKENWNRNKDKYNAAASIRQKKNRKELNAYRRKYEVERRANDPEYKLICDTRKRVITMFKLQNLHKGNKTLRLLGWTPETPKLINALPNAGKKGYQLDHIIPCMAFDLTIEGALIACWSIENLQYIPAKENLSKKDRVDLPYQQPLLVKFEQYLKPEYRIKAA